MVCEWSRPTAVSVTESQTLAGTLQNSASWLREAHSFPPGWGEPSWTRKSGSLGNLGQTSSRLQITHDGLIEACQSEQKQDLIDMHSNTCRLTYGDTQRLCLFFKTLMSFFSSSLIKSYLKKNFDFTKLVVESNKIFAKNQTMNRQRL